MTSQELTSQEVYETYFKTDFCIGCGKEKACYTDTETGYPLCLDCIETACEAARFGLHYTDPLPEPTFPTPDAGNGGHDRTNPALRTIGTR